MTRRAPKPVLLRPSHARPAEIRVLWTAPPSWWCTAPREHFLDLALQHLPLMRGSSGERQTPVRILS